MKKIITGIIALFALLFLAGCEMTYGNKYPVLVQYYCCYGDSSGNWKAQTTDTLMTYNASTLKYEITVTTTKKNQRFEITKGASYSIEYMAKDADAATQAAFPKTADNGFGSLQTVLPTAGSYLIAFDASTETYSVTAK